MRAPWGGVRDWVFDLDNTLYPAAATIYDAVEARMTAYIANALGVDASEAARVRERYFHQYGATVIGLARHHHVDAHDFLQTVHDVSFEELAPDHELNALIGLLPGRKVVFTNGGARYARNVLRRLELDALIDEICDIESAGLAAKPEIAAYDALIAHARISPEHAALIEDSLRNLAPAHALGFRTALVGALAAPVADFIDARAPDLKSLLRAALESP